MAKITLLGHSLWLFIYEAERRWDILTGVLRPDPTDQKFDKWEIENSFIMAWLINSMILEIGEGYYGMKLLKIFGIQWLLPIHEKGTPLKSLS